MNIITAIPKIYTAAKAGLRLKSLYESRTTANAIEGTGLVSIAVGVLVAYLLRDQSTEVQVAVMGLAVSTVAPLVSRIIAFAKHPEKAPDAPLVPKIQNPDILLKFAQRKDEFGIWRVYIGTVLDAHEEGIWIRGRSHADKIYLIGTGECIGDYVEPVRTPDGNPLEKLFVEGVGKRGDK